MRMHIFHMTFQSNELEKNDTLPKWHIHTSDNRIERQEKPLQTKKTQPINQPKKPKTKTQKPPPQNQINKQKTPTTQTNKQNPTKNPGKKNPLQTKTQTNPQMIASCLYHFLSLSQNP